MATIHEQHMNIILKTKFRDYGNGDRHIHIPAVIVKAAGIKNGDVFDIDYVDGVITLKKTQEAQKK